MKGCTLLNPPLSKEERGGRGIVEPGSGRFHQTLRVTATGALV